MLGVSTAVPENCEFRENAKRSNGTIYPTDLGGSPAWQSIGVVRTVRTKVATGFNVEGLHVLHLLYVWHPFFDKYFQV